MSPDLAVVPDFESIHADLFPKGLAYLRRFVGADEAEDLAQEVFIRVHQGLPGFRGESRLSTWVHQIATHLALDRMRSAPQLATVEQRVQSFLP